MPLDGDILATKRGSGDGLVSRQPDFLRLLILSKKEIFVSWNSGFPGFLDPVAISREQEELL